jgi:hypothetical protein
MIFLRKTTDKNSVWTIQDKAGLAMNNAGIKDKAKVTRDNTEVTITGETTRIGVPAAAAKNTIGKYRGTEMEKSLCAFFFFVFFYR